MLIDENGLMVIPDDCLIMLYDNDNPEDEESEIIFRISNTSVRDIRQKFSSGWSKSDRAGFYPFWQATKEASEALTMSGFFLTPHHQGSMKSKAKLETLFKNQKPLCMIMGDGKVVKMVIMTNLEFNKTIFMPDGTPLKVDFTIGLESYYD